MKPKAASFDPDAEFVDGDIEERPMAQYDHNNWQQAILDYFLHHAKEWGIRSVFSQRIKIREGCYRVPDVAILDRVNPKEQVVTRPPMGLFEVLSPEDAVQRLNRKLRDYEEMGIPQVWVLDPEIAIFTRYHHGSLIPLKHFLEREIEGIEFQIAEIAQWLQD
jgi:Uma2 family endonuclease